MKLIQAMSLAILVACLAPISPPSNGEDSPQARAALGVETVVPPEELAAERGLEVQVRQQGRLVTSVARDGAADRAGIRSGDVLLLLGDVVLYSKDDIDDFLSVKSPGDEVSATIVREQSQQREELLVKLGSGTTLVPAGIAWQHASLAQLPAALEQARAEKKKVLVGLSGAET